MTQRSRSCAFSMSLSFAQQIEEDANEKILLLRAAFGDHQGHGHESRVGDDPPAMLETSRKARFISWSRFAFTE